MIIFFVVNINIAKCINGTLLLTHSSNKHIIYINVLKFNDDYTSVYSVDAYRIMKIWDFNILNFNILKLRQNFLITGYVY
jgi:hypothetical protein